MATGTVMHPGPLTDAEQALLQEMRRTSLALTEARLVMLGPAYANKIPPDKADDVLELCVRIQAATMMIDNASLSLILDKMPASIDALRTATAGLEAELKNLRRVNQVLDLAGALLGVISKIMVVF